MSNNAATDFQVSRADLLQRRFVAIPPMAEAHVDEGAALLQVDAFAFTSNNLTYAALGSSFNYWDFFPAPAGWGRIPAWGFGTVTRSRADGVAPGTRYYGYFPMSTYVVMEPWRVTPKTFSDGASHRATLHPLYNQYALTPSDDDASDALMLVLRPLFIASFVVDDFLLSEKYFDARRIVVSSASSKTAFGLAFLLRSRKRDGATFELLGLTSAQNAAFVAGLGFYDRVVTYDDVQTLPTDAPAVFVDFASNAALTTAVHARLGATLRFSSAIGYTHRDEPAGTTSAPVSGPAPVPFFAPAQIRKRARDWGPGGFEQRFGLAWNRFVDALRAADSTWLRIQRSEGIAAVERVYDAAVAGTLRPQDGHILTLREMRREARTASVI